jgi:hypothetical protein
LATVGGIDARNGHEVDRLRHQVEVMLGHVLDKGLTPAPQAWMFEAVRDPAAVVDLAGEGWNPAGTEADRKAQTEALVRAHRDLSRMIAPARPATLELLQRYREARKPLRTARIPRQKGQGVAGAPATNGPYGKGATGWAVPVGGSTVPLVRWLVFGTFFFLAVFVLLAATPHARAASAGIGLSGGVSGQAFGTLLLRELFLLCAAALGACLTSLYRASKEVSRGTYDPEFDHTFVQRVLLGMAAGLILAELIPLGTGGDTALSTLGRPAIALVGGFAAGVVHSVLSRFVAAVETLFSGDQDDQEDARRELAQKRADEVLAQADRATLAKLLEIRRIASSGAPTRAIIDEIDRMIALVAPA